MFNRFECLYITYSYDVPSEKVREQINTELLPNIYCLVSNSANTTTRIMRLVRQPMEMRRLML